MESCSQMRIQCIDCSGLCYPSQIRKGSETCYEQLTCKECNFENFAIKCPYCSFFVISLFHEELSPGVIIKCHNRACKKDFQYLTCPNPGCRKLNYRQNSMPMGVKTCCDYCLTQFQDVVCDFCYTENYFKCDSPDSCYYSGVKTGCRGCKGGFVQFSCCGCNQTIYQDAKTYAAGMKVQCEHCSTSFQQTNCGGCGGSNYYFNNELKVGMLEECAGCGKTYKTYVCKNCGDIEQMVIQLPPLTLLYEVELVLRKIVTNRCKRCNVISEQLPCLCCGQACYVTTSELAPGPSKIRCIGCHLLTTNLFKCQICSSTFLTLEARTTCYVSHPIAIENNVSVSGSQSDILNSFISPSAQDRSRDPFELIHLRLSSLSSSNRNNPPQSQLIPREGSLSQSRCFSSAGGQSRWSSESRLAYNTSRSQTLQPSNNQSFKMYQKNYLNAIKDSDTPTESQEKRCCVCLLNEKKAVFIPCGHLSCCLGCTNVIMQNSKECPICKIKIENFQRIYAV